MNRFKLFFGKLSKKTNYLYLKQKKSKKSSNYLSLDVEITKAVSYNILQVLHIGKKRLFCHAVPPDRKKQSCWERLFPMLTSLLPAAGTELLQDKGMLMAVITCSGILIVFMILLLLILIFYAYGGIFGAVTASKAKKLAAKKTAASEKAQQTSGSPAPAAAPAPSDDGEIPPEIIAVIAAAVAAVSGGKKYAVKKVSRAQRQTGMRSAWASSGIYENTRPF